MNVTFYVERVLIESQAYYCTYVINTDLAEYTGLPEQQKIHFKGTAITYGSGNHKKVYYNSIERIESALREKYGSEWLRPDADLVK